MTRPTSDYRWTERHVKNWETMGETDQDEELLGVSAEALDAHHQVLEMARTIEILTRDFENQQKELAEAYRRLQAYAIREARWTDGNDQSDSDEGDNKPFMEQYQATHEHHRHSPEKACCSHQMDLEEMQRLVEVKNTALTDALQQRNEYRVRLNQAEILIKDLRATIHMEAKTDSRGGNGGWKVHPAVSTMSQYHVMGATSSSHAVTTPTFAIPGSCSTAILGGSNGAAIEVPRNERFDNESTYHRKENDDLFWRKQYKEAVRMRKKYGLVATTGNGGSSSSSTHPNNNSNSHHSHGGMRPSLKIFSYPDNRRQKGIVDENVPFTRYIGISTRQNEIIKEHHRMLS